MSETAEGAAEKPPPRPSGLKPPSKIGRVCAAGPPKPAVPLSPKSNDPTTEAMRKISDDYSRKHLADVQEADEDAEGSSECQTDSTPPRDRKPSTCSTYSITSMEAIWELHPRRLSEAGLRRTSDHSIVLTEDTDGFIIGDRVYVGGSKPGQIAYIGDTQFAPGEWAGVVLEEPIGKNDGSVAGIRYFQCEQKKGVFSRLTRLTREPLGLPSPTSPGSEYGSFMTEKHITNERVSSTNGAKPPPSPGSVSSIPRVRQQRSTSPNGSMKSFSSRISTSTNAGELRLGERVIVSSSQGSKAGTLRFMGPTDFATGQWCGVELDDPIGKNDGSVEGKRYFECGPRFGLFAPLAKVSRSPSNRRPGSCAVHGRGSPPDSLASSVMSTTGSIRPRLGVTSLGAGTQRLSGPRAVSTPMSAKNTLQELLREKQQHIERLMKELDAEKGELTEKNMKIDFLQKEIVAVKAENGKYTEEMTKLKTEHAEITRQLEDEKQKVDDLLFRAEEDNIHKDDFNKAKEDMMEAKEKLDSKITELETELTKSKSQLEEIQMQNELMSSQHKAEVDVILAQHKDEVQAAQALASELQSLLDEAHTLLREKELENENVNKNHFEETSKSKSESEKIINELKTKLSEAQLELSAYVASSNENLSEAEKKLASLNEKFEKSIMDNNNNMSDHRRQLEQKQIALDTKIQEYNQIVAASKETELNNKKEIEKLKMQLSSLNLDYESTIENKKSLEENILKLQNELKETTSELNKKDSELETVTSSASKEQVTIQNEIKQLKDDVDSKQKLIEKICAESEEQKKSLEKQIEDHVNNLTKNEADIKELQNKIESIKAEFSQTELVKQEEHVKLMLEKDDKIQNLQKQHEEQSTKLLNEFNEQKVNLSSEISKHLNEIENLKSQINDYNVKLNDVSKNYSEANSSASNLQLTIADLERQLNSQITKNNELTEQKDKLEKDITDLTSSSSNSDEQLNTLSKKFREAENEIQSMKDTLRDNTNEFKRNEEKLLQQHDIFKTQTAEEKESFNLRLKQHEEQKNKYEDQIKNLTDTMKNLQEKYDANTLLINELEIKHALEKQDYDNKIAEKESEKATVKKQLEENIQHLQQRIKELNTEFENMKTNVETSEGMVNKKLDQFEEVKNKLDRELEESKDKEVKLQESYNLLNEKLNKEQENFNSALKAKEDREKILESEVLKLKESSEEALKNTQDKEAVIKELQKKISDVEIELKSNIEIVSEKERQINVNSDETKNILEEKHSLEKLLNSTKSDYELLSQKLVLLNESIATKEKLLSDHISGINELKQRISSLDNESGEIMLNDNNFDLVVFYNLFEKYYKFKEKCTLLQNDIESTNVSHSQNENNLKLSNDKLEKELLHSQKLSKELQDANEKYLQLKSQLETSEADMKKITLMNESRAKIGEELNQSKIDYNKLKDESELKYNNLMKQLDEHEKQILNKNQELSLEQSNGKELQSKIESANNEISAFKVQIKQLEESMTKIDADKNKESKNILLESQNKEKLHVEEVKMLNGKISTLNDAIAKKNGEFGNLTNQISSLSEDLKKTLLQNESMKNEIDILTSKLNENNNLIVKTNVKTVENKQQSNDIDAKKLLEEKEEVEGRVNFLNSVIVDMQKKNEELKARVEILEMGVSPQEVDDFNQNGFKVKMVAPRMFCDICDVFDAHETEDCPRQTNDVIDYRQGDKKKAPAAARPYCELCEVFGHATEDCDEEETF